MTYDGAHEALQTDEDVIDAHFKLIMVLLRQEGPYTLPADDSYADPEITSWVAEARSVCHYALEGHSVHGNPHMSAESLGALKEIGRAAAAKLRDVSGGSLEHRPPAEPWGFPNDRGET